MREMEGKQDGKKGDKEETRMKWGRVIGGKKGENETGG